MKKLSSLLLLALTGGLACGATDGVPAHIVQPLPKELDPRLEPVSYTHLTLPTKLEV